ncbi:MAG: type II toxin-antitoxin system RelE/ParE family toxin [Deltaproteobacteria bacterium]|nr:type II toxin-antitoxin system RelE/ParE family toxin [Deltaproteobacteria bacterium]
MPFLDWLELLDFKTEARIRNRLTRLEMGNMGDCKAIGEGIFELRLFFGPGYRVYFGEINSEEVLLLIGGSKNYQKKDIKKAREFWKSYKELMK